MKGREIFERTIPEAWTVLRLPLLPLSLGHVELLNRFDSAFMVGRAPDYDDLALSVFICSRDYEEALEGLSDPPSLLKEMARWKKKVGEIDLDEKCDLFRGYLNAHELRLEKGKDYVTSSEGTRSVGVPFVHLVRVKLQSRMHFSDADIRNRSWALCLLDYYVLADLDGVIALTDEDRLKVAVTDAQSIAGKVAELLKAGKVRI